MTAPPCMDCREPDPRLLDGTSDMADVNYYRCDFCGCVFCVPKDRPNAPPQCVVPGRMVPT